MENRDGGLKFDDALSFVRPRPWLVDDLGNLKILRKISYELYHRVFCNVTYKFSDITLTSIYGYSFYSYSISFHISFIFLFIDTWKSRLRLNAGNEPHKCAAIFIDNSGVDVILGILPFVEHLLSRGTEV